MAKPSNAYTNLLEAEPLRYANCLGTASKFGCSGTPLELPKQATMDTEYRLLFSDMGVDKQAYGS